MDVFGADVKDGSHDRTVLPLPPSSDVDPSLSGIERQRPGPALGGQGHAFPALPRPSGKALPPPPPPAAHSTLQ